MQHWEFVEAIQAPLRHYKSDRRIAVQLHIIVFIILTLIAGE